MRILSLNLSEYGNGVSWNIDTEEILNLIISSNIDIIALQNVRFAPDLPMTRMNHLNTAEYLLQELIKRNDKYRNTQLVFNPSVYFSRTNDHTKNKICCSANWEGLAIISTFPFIETGTRCLSFNPDSIDNKRRITQYGTVQCGKRCLTVFNTHLTIDHNEAQRNVEETISYINSLNPRKYLLTGTFNFTPENECLSYFLSSDMSDLWSKIKPTEDGYTCPNEYPTRRIDYVLINSELDSYAKNIELADLKISTENIFKHKPIISEFDI